MATEIGWDSCLDHDDLYKENWVNHSAFLLRDHAPNRIFKQTEVELNPGDVVIMFSDGVTEARNLRGELYQQRGSRRLLRKLAETQGGPEAVGNAILHDIREFSSGHAQVDDITLLCFGPIA